jgi:inner membrane protein
MKLQTHIAFGILLGMLFYYFFNIDISFFLLVGISAFLPDIDWAMQYKWGFGNVHREVLHNIWAMMIFAIIGFFISNNLIVVFGIIIGFLCHLLADSFTVMGVYWLWPYGDESIFGQRKFYKNGSLNMSDPSEGRIEKYLQIIMLTFAGFLLLTKGLSINLFSIEGIITIAIMFAVGFILMKKFRNILVKIIRSLHI